MLLFAVHAPAARAADRHVETINKTGQAMASFFASKVGAKLWEEDILGESVEKANMSVCKISTFTYDP